MLKTIVEIAHEARSNSYHITKREKEFLIMMIFNISLKVKGQVDISLPLDHAPVGVLIALRK